MSDYDYVNVFVSKYAEIQIQEEYYATMLLKMEEEIVKLKNEH